MSVNSDTDVEKNTDYWDTVASVQSTVKANILKATRSDPKTPTQIKKWIGDNVGKDEEPILGTVCHAISRMRDEDLVTRLTSKRPRDNLYRASDKGREVLDEIEG